MPSKAEGGKSRYKKYVVQPKECFSVLLRTLMILLPIPMQGRYGTIGIHSLAIAMASQKQTNHSFEPFLSDQMSETNFRHHISKFKITDFISLNQRLLTNPVIKQFFFPVEYEYFFAVRYLTSSQPPERPRMLSGWLFLQTASSGHSPISSHSAPCSLRLYHVMNSSKDPNVHRCCRIPARIARPSHSFEVCFSLTK